MVNKAFHIMPCSLCSCGVEYDTTPFTKRVEAGMDADQVGRWSNNFIWLLQPML